MISQCTCTGRPSFVFAEYSTHREPSEKGISLPKTHPSGSEPVHVTKSKADSGNVCISGYKKTAPNFRTVVLSYHFLTVFTISCFRKINLTSTKLFRIIVKLYRGVAQLVARLVRVQEAVGSTPATPTNPGDEISSPGFFSSNQCIICLLCDIIVIWHPVRNAPPIFRHS